MNHEIVRLVPQIFSNDYQSFDGSCNNLDNPFFDKSNTPYKRMISPEYGDGVNSPRTLAV